MYTEMDPFFDRCPVHGHSILLPSLISDSLSPRNRVRASLHGLNTVEVPVVRVRKVSVRAKETFQALNAPTSCPNRKASPYPSFKVTGTRYFRSFFPRATVPDRDFFTGLRRKESVLMKSVVVNQHFQAREMEVPAKHTAIRLKRAKRHVTSVPPAAVSLASPLVSQPVSPRNHGPVVTSASPNYFHCLPLPTQGCYLAEKGRGGRFSRKNSKMAAETAEKLANIVTRLTGLHQLVAEHAARQETTLGEALSLTDSDLASTPRLYLSPSRSPLSPIPEEDEEADPADLSLLLIQSVTAAFNRVFDTEQLILNVYKDYLESQVPELKQAKTTLQKVQGQYEQETEKVDMLTERLQGLQEELELIQQGREEWCPRCGQLEDKLVASESKLRKARREIQEMKEQCEAFESRNEEMEGEMRRLEEDYGRTQARLEEKEEKAKLAEEAVKSKSLREEDLLRRSSLLESSTSTLQSELLALKKAKEQLEISNSDLIRRLEDAEGKYGGVYEALHASESEGSVTKQSLEKARILVKKLNEESEGLAKQLRDTETKEKQIRRESHSMERSYADLQKKVQEVDILRKTEERLRQELASLKQEYRLLQEEREEEVRDLHSSIEQILDEKAQLATGLTVLEEKITIIEKENHERERILQSSQQRSQALEAELAQRLQDFQHFRAAAEAKDSEREAEMGLYKRQAENVLRYYQGLQGEADLGRSRSIGASPMKKKTQMKLTTTIKPSKKEEESKEMTDSKALLTSESLFLQLEEALQRESVLKQELSRLADTEAHFLRERVAALGNMEASFRPEVERWMLRSEELEQRLLETAAKNAQLLRLLQDCQKTILIKNRQMADQSRVWNSLTAELQSSVDFLQVELDSRDHLILEELVPRSQSTLSAALSAAHGKIQQMNSDFVRLRSTAEEACGLLEREKDRSDSLLDENQRIREETDRVRGTLEQVEGLVRGDRAIPPGQGEDGKSLVSLVSELLDRERELVNELAEKRRLFQDLNTTKQEGDLVKQRYVDEIKGMELLWREKEGKWTGERQALAEEIRQIKLIAQRDSDSKLSLQTQLEREVDSYRSELESLHSQLAARNSETLSLHKRLAEVQKAFDSLTSEHEITKTRLMKEIESLEVEIRSVQEELTRAKMQARDAQHEVRSLAERHEQTVQALHSETNRPRSVLATYQALSNRGSPLRPDREGDSDSPNDHLVQELYLTRAALKKREDEISSLSADLKASDQALRRKAAYATDLEQQLDFYKARKEAIFSDTDTDNFKLDASEIRPELQPLDLVDENNRLRRKQKSEKRSFQKRVKEFELILRYLEDQINRLTDPIPRAVNSKMAELIAELAVKNATLDGWLHTLCEKLERFGQMHGAVVQRERRTYEELASTILSTGQGGTDIKRTLDYLSQDGADLDRAGRDLISGLRTTLLSSALTRHRRLESFGAIKAVLIDQESADLLLNVSQEVTELERLWRDRAANLMQVAAKADDLVSSVRRMDRSHPTSDRILDKVLDMFQKIFRSFQSDISSDLLHLSSLSNSLTQVLSSSPEADLSQMVTISSYHRRNAQIVREDRPREVQPLLLDQMERLNSELTRH